MSKFGHREILSIACLRLKNAAPEEWDKFQQAFNVYRDFINDFVAEADVSHIMVAKGAALQCRELCKIFEECERMKDKA